MLTLVTGAPGAGKTLWTMREVENLRKETGRPVVFNGIAGVEREGWAPLTMAQLKATIPSKEEEGKNEFDLPRGAIVVVDEVYRIWPQGKPGEKLPPDIEAFAVHRHLGLDFYLLVQDRQRLHHFIRGLVGRHVHFERQFGMQRSRRFEWQRLADPRDRFERMQASASEFLFPKEVYSWYKSADLHTVKKRLPWARLAVIPALLACAAGGLWFAFSMVAGGIEGQGEAQLQAAQVAAQPVAAQETREVAALHWSQQWAERVPGQPHSAAFYDPTVKPAAMPKISGCLEVQTDTSYKCQCNTQQGTIISTMTTQECRFYLRNGWFDPTKPDEDPESDLADGRSHSVPDFATGSVSPSGGGADSGAAAPPPAIAASVIGS